VTAAPLHLTATPGRLDAVLAELTGASRSQAAGWIAGGHVQVGGVVAQKASLKLRGGEALAVQVPPPPDATVTPELVPLDVLYEDDVLIALNKPPGMVTHPAPGLTSGTLVNALLGRMRLPEQPGAQGSDGYRPGIVHRLDKDTSGVIVVAKTVEAHARLAAAGQTPPSTWTPR
jgi:23S rRNA pseudouridine1911/1915/1917 synthase